MGVKEDFFRLKTACLEAKGSDREKAEQEMDRFFDSLRPEDQQELQAAIDEDFVRIHQVRFLIVAIPIITIRLIWQQWQTMLQVVITISMQ